MKPSTPTVQGLLCSVHAWPQHAAQTVNGKEVTEGTRVYAMKAYDLRKPRVPNSFSLCLIEVALRNIMM